MIFNLANSIFIIVGSLVGLFLKKGFPDRIRKSLVKAMGLCVLLIGISLALKGKNILLIVVSVALGTVIGEIIDFDGKITRFGENLQKKLMERHRKTSLKNNIVNDSNDNKIDSGVNNEINDEVDEKTLNIDDLDDAHVRTVRFVQGFITSSVLFCAGAMGVVASLNIGLTGDGSTLLVKGLIDGVIACIFATGFGIGVMFSSVSVFIYQAFFIILASILSKYLGPEVIASVNGVGGITVIGIGLNLAIDSDIKVANIELAVFIPMILSIFGIV